MDQPDTDNAQSRRPAAKKLDRMRERLRHSAQRNRNVVEGLACVLGLLIGIVLGIAFTREAPAGHIFAEGRAGAASLPLNRRRAARP